MKKETIIARRNGNGVATVCSRSFSQTSIHPQPEVIMKTEAQLIWKWQKCEDMAKAQKLNLMTNAANLISILDHGKFLYNGETVAEIYAFLSAKEQS